MTITVRIDFDGAGFPLPPRVEVTPPLPDEEPHRWGRKLTSAKVREIRQLASQGGASYVELGEMFGVSSDQVRNIVTRKSWKQVR